MLAAVRNLAYALGRLVPIEPKTVAQGTELCRLLGDQRFATTLGRLSKAGDDPQQIVSEYRQASDALAGVRGPDGFYLSLKSPALRFDADLAGAIAAGALANGHGVHFDSHKFLEADPTFELIEKLLKRSLPQGAPGAGWRFSISLPTRWKRSVADAAWAAERGIRVRLVKGDFGADAADEVDPVAGCLELVDRIPQVPELALASHDCALALETVLHCRKNLPDTRLKLELFFGRPASAMLALARDLATPVGFYVPYGETLSVYLVRDLITNPLKLLRPDALEIFGTRQAKLARIARVR